MATSQSFQIPSYTVGYFLESCRCSDGILFPKMERDGTKNLDAIERCKCCYHSTTGYFMSSPDDFHRIRLLLTPRKLGFRWDFNADKNNCSISRSRSRIYRRQTNWLLDRQSLFTKQLSFITIASNFCVLTLNENKYILEYVQFSVSLP